jgi:tetratricopeptide (TPR) repeat protein
MRKLRLKSCFAVLTISVAALQSPAMSQASFQQAVQDYNSGKYGRALSEFKSMEASYPNNALTHYYIALCEQTVGHLEQARAEFRWVIANGNSQLKAMATTGLNQLANAKTQVSYAPSATASAPASPTSTAPKAKVKKILEFYADW